MADGYEIRGKSVRVYFRFEGELCREKIGEATPENIEKARRLAQVINYEIDAGTFDYARHFPDSTRISENSFGHYADLLLQIRASQVADSTIKADRSKMRSHIMPKWQAVNIDSIDHINIQTWMAEELARLSSKTIKEVINLTSQVFDLYATRKKTAHNPCKGVKVRLPDAEDPDPFTLDEINALVTCETNREQERDMIEFMIWDGCRLSEAIALAWEDVVDIEQGIVRYQRARVNGKWKVTKTKRSTRTHRLLKPAREALQRQYAITASMAPIDVEVKDRDNKTLRKQRIRPVFRRTSGEPHYSDMTVRDRFFKTHCEKAGVRYRPPGQCRHTFISQMLTLGVVPMQWIAAHVGHTTIAMIQKHYGKWIQQDGPDIHQVVERSLDL